MVKNDEVRKATAAGKSVYRLDKTDFTDHKEYVVVFAHFFKYFADWRDLS